jgi:diguanylate cyclase (GGDEF)-like protein
MKKRIFRLLPLLVGVSASLALLAALLWQRSPVLAIALAGPLLALVLYDRSIRRGRAAMRLALLDPLTGLGNQRSFRERLQEELDRAAREQGPLALCLLDVDAFKRINDEQGHPVGDRVLVEVASCLRRDGEAFRLGGDEFALVLPGRGEREAADVAGAVVARLSTLAPAPAGRVTVSAGVASFPEDGATRDELVECADARLYRAKSAGGNRVEIRHEPVAAAGNGTS